MADTYELDPAVRVEEILNGDDIEPANRLEYFLKKAATEVPKPTAADAGKDIKVNAEGNGYELADPIFIRGSAADSAVLYNPDEPNIATGADGAISGGSNSEASGNVSLALGNHARATSISAVAIGGRIDGETYGPVASGAGSVAIGMSASASGPYSTSIGYMTQASGQGSAAFGGQTNASGTMSIALGRQTVASGSASVAGGRYSEAKAIASGAFGYRTLANGSSSFVIGQSNIEDTNAEDASHGSGARKYLFIIGNGDRDATARSNALTVDWDGNLVCRNIPAPPAAAGIYTLRCTVDASGAASYSWA